ncbi:hypothetical protein DsansV1_C36g0231781 [Dioscorea sansibarensis]
MNLEDESAPPNNVPLDCEPMDTSNQRHEAPSHLQVRPLLRLAAHQGLMVKMLQQKPLGIRWVSWWRQLKSPKREPGKKNSLMLYGTWRVMTMKTWKWFFERLIVNKNLAESFYLRKPSLLKRWLDNFIASMSDSSS